jgi:flagellar hook-associated protein 1 FlgK
VLLEKLAAIVDVKISHQNDGSVNVYSGGHILVQRDTAVPLTLSQSASGGVVKSTLGIGENGRPFAPESGELKALIEIRDQDLGGALADLDEFARELAGAVNTAHRAGYGLNNAHDIDFFATDIAGAATFSLSAAITDDIRNIATGGSADAPGDNSVALAIAGLQNERLLNGGQSTLDEFYRQGVLNVSSKREFARNELAVQQGAAENLRTRRQQVSGVSMDEEMARLIQVQNAYEAAAKIVRTVDEMMQTVISLGV